MMQHAAEHGANAVVGMRYDANDVMSGVTEVLAYGTAVVLEKGLTEGMPPFSPYSYSFKRFPMRSLIICSALCTVLFAAAPGVFSQQPIPSPRDSVFLSLDTNVISVNYGRPSMRGRKIMGGSSPGTRSGARAPTRRPT